MHANHSEPEQWDFVSTKQIWVFNFMLYINICSVVCQPLVRFMARAIYNIRLATTSTQSPWQTLEHPHPFPNPLNLPFITWLVLSLSFLVFIHATFQ